MKILFVAVSTLFISMQAFSQDSLKTQTEHKKSRFWHNSETGFSVGNANYFSNGFHFQTINGFRVYKNAYLGLATGLDMYRDATLLPVLLHARWDFLPEKKISPYIGVSGGRTLGLTKMDNIYSLKGGFTGEISTGFKVNRGNGTGYTFSLGYRYQKFQEKLNVLGERTTDYGLNRFVIRTGFFF